MLRKGEEKGTQTQGVKGPSVRHPLLLPTPHSIGLARVGHAHPLAPPLHQSPLEGPLLGPLCPLHVPLSVLDARLWMTSQISPSSQHFPPCLDSSLAVNGSL